MELEAVGSQPALGSLLKSLRQRIPRTADTLGPSKRLPSRCGRPVTQEELAEVVGVSRGWYRMLESGATVRPSIQLLGRLAQTLSLSVEERSTLFALGMPAINRTKLYAEISALLEVFSWVRALTKRLWVASSENEAYLDVCERIAIRFSDAELVQWMRRTETGVWERHCFVNRGPRQIAEITKEIHAELRPSGVDKLMLYPLLHEPGSVGTAEHLAPATQRARLHAYARRGLTAPDFMHGRVRSRGGVVGGISVYHPKGRSYSATEYTVLGGLAELISLALS
jgi:transcriptional regulator with XRE-family HTH domain